MNYKISKFNLLIAYSDTEYLLFNTYSTCLIKLPKINYRQIKSNITNEAFVLENSEIISRLHDLGIVISEDFDEIESIKMKNNQWRNDKNSYAVAIVPNIDCNFRCKYCFEDIEEKYMSEETIENIEKYFEKRIISNKIERFGVSWYGGEPLLSKNIIERLSKTFIKAKSYKAYLFTNGFDMDEQFIRNLVNYKIGLVHITIDGPKDIHDKYRSHKNGVETFDRIMDNIQKIITYHNDTISINIRTNLDNANKDYYGDLLDSFREIESNKISFQIHTIQEPLTGVGKTYCGEPNTEESDLIFRYAREELIKSNYRIPEYYLPKSQDCKTCSAGMENGFTINYDGYIYKCFGDVNPPRNSVGVLNNVGEIDFITDEFFRWTSHNSLEIEQCQNCILLPVCMGGCIHQRLGLTPNLPSKCNKIVELKNAKKSILEVYELINKQK